MLSCYRVFDGGSMVTMRFDVEGKIHGDREK